MYKVYFFLFFFAVADIQSFGQKGSGQLITNKGIKFEQDVSWDDILKKAKSENKYIFLDCYTTWCGYCKKMDKEVFSTAEIGNYVNENFVSVKLQMDSSSKDSFNVRKRYNEARIIERKYKVTSFPSYLFFSPDGQIVHRDNAYKNVENFLSLLFNAKDKNKQYYTLLEKYKRGEKDYVSMPYLAKLAQNMKETQLSHEIAQDYINNYLFKLDSKEIYKKENIEFIFTFTRSSKDSSFDLFYTQAYKIDKILNSEGISERLIDYIITTEEINPIIADVKEGKTPNWDKSFNSIRTKYNKDYALRNVLSAKVRWYRFKSEWAKCIKNMIRRVDKYGPFGLGVVDFDYNNHAWFVFQYSNNVRDLNKALKWSESAVLIAPKIANWLDTKANLLYKLGRTEEAIALEGDVNRLDSNSKEFRENLAKMKKGEPTWPVVNKSLRRNK